MNLPVQKFLFDLPSFRCSGCGSPFLDDFEFCFDLVKANTHQLIGGLGNVKYQSDSPECIAFSIASCLEIAKRIRKVFRGKDPDSVKGINPFEIVEMFEEKCRHGMSYGETGIGKLVTMALTVQNDGITSEDHLKHFSAVAVETIDKFDFEKICSVLADGIPLIGTLYSGDRLKNLKYGQIYKAPKLARFLEKGIIPVGHAVVIIGAGMHSGQQYLYFLNSWGAEFCPRYDQDGNLVKGGVGKMRLYDLICNPILFATNFTECVGQNRLMPMNIGKLSDYNKRVLMGERQTNVALLVSRAQISTATAAVANGAIGLEKLASGLQS
uniref:Peptidase C1A papain C-terminal domain-containing protein n=1 Tax=Oryza brachyantha TaxID=4533 RepID=J3N234_ORYBR